MSMPLAAILTHWKEHTPKRIRQLLSVARTWEECKKISSEKLREAHWNDATIASFFSWKNNFDIDSAEEYLVKKSINICEPESATYPKLLSPLTDKPLALFFRGTLKAMPHMLAVVGTRESSQYGMTTVDTILSPLARTPLGVVSGMALGIDGKAHNTAIENNLYTVAVLGSGVDNESLYPRAHTRIAEKILESGGAIISEYPPGFKPTPYSFPARNRIIAGMSHATLVIEGAEDSGSLLTAKAALEYGRDVAAIPHPIGTRHGAGPNRLIRDGAALIRNSEDIAELLSMQTYSKSQQKPAPELSTEEMPLYAYISTHGPVHIDTLVQENNIPTEKAMTILTLLEIEGHIRKTGPMEFVAV